MNTYRQTGLQHRWIQFKGTLRARISPQRNLFLSQYLKKTVELWESFYAWDLSTAGILGCRGEWNWRRCGRKVVTECGWWCANTSNRLFRMCQHGDSADIALSSEPDHIGVWSGSLESSSHLVAVRPVRWCSLLILDEKTLSAEKCWLHCDGIICSSGLNYQGFFTLNVNLHRICHLRHSIFHSSHITQDNNNHIVSISTS